MASRLHKSARDKILFGVCGGLAEHFDIDPVWVRVAFVLLIPAGAIGPVFYIVLALIMPKAGAESLSTRQVVSDNLRDMPGDAADAASAARESMRPAASQPTGGETPQRRDKTHMKNAVAFILIAIGALFLLNNLGFFSFRWDVFWPVLIIAIGVAMLLRRSRF